MPEGKVRFYDPEKGFGFITKNGGGDVYVRASVLPAGVATLKPGQRVEFGVVEHRGGLGIEEHTRATLLDDLIPWRGLRGDLDGELGLASGADAQSGVIRHFGTVQQAVDRLDGRGGKREH